MLGSVIGMLVQALAGGEKNYVVPEENISTFGFCKAPGNEGAPCEPLTCQKWQYGKDDVLIDEEPALLDSSTLTCTKGGTISIVSDGQE
ncbi:hypothetical protein D3C77_462620 [compost metagenome]